MHRRELLLVVSMVATIFVPIFSVFVLSGQQWKEAEDKAHARRLAEARMNARLLRLDT